MRYKVLSQLIFGCALALCGCSDHSDPSSAISEEVGVYGSSESYALSRESFSSLPVDYNMWLSAVYHNEPLTSHEYFFQKGSGSVDLKFSYNSSSNVWTNDVYTFIFPLNGYMDFLGYATLNSDHKPSASFSPAVLSPDNNSFSSLSLDFGSSLDASDPVLYSDLSSIDCKKISTLGKPVVNFRQALSKIVFYLRTTDANTASFLRIYGLTLKSVNCSGVLTVSPGIPSTAVWSSVTKAADVAVPGEDSFKTPKLVSSDSDIGTCFGTPLYLPTQLGASSINLDVSYHITTPSSNFDSRPTLPVNIPLPTGNWLPGLQYTYTLTFSSLNEVSVECSDVGVIIDSQPVDLIFDEIY